MTRTQRLRPVVQHSDDKAQRALEAVAHSRSLLDAEKQKLRQLQGYRSEYLQKQQQASGVFNAIELQEFNRFMRQLDETIERQNAVIGLRETELAQKQAEWKTTRIDSKKMHRVVEKLEDQEKAAEDKREQKAMDEFAQRLHRQSD